MRRALIGGLLVMLVGVATVWAWSTTSPIDAPFDPGADVTWSIERGVVLVRVADVRLVRRGQTSRFTEYALPLWAVAAVLIGAVVLVHPAVTAILAAVFSLRRLSTLAVLVIVVSAAIWAWSYRNPGYYGDPVSPPVVQLYAEEGGVYFNVYSELQLGYGSLDWDGGFRGFRTRWSAICCASLSLQGAWRLILFMPMWIPMAIGAIVLATTTLLSRVLTAQALHLRGFPRATFTLTGLALIALVVCAAVWFSSHRVYAQQLQLAVGPWEAGAEDGRLYARSERSISMATLFGPGGGPLPNSIPIWPVALLLAIVAAALLRLSARILRRPGQGLCRTCGYDLRGSRERCPECGESNSATMPEASAGGASEVRA